MLLGGSAALAQMPAKRFKWKQLGPFTTPPTLTEVGKKTAVGMGWVEDLLVTDNALYAGSITGGLFKSTSGGKRWRKTDDDTLQMGTLCLLQVGDTLYRGTGLTHYDDKFGVGLLYSTNKGKTWHQTGLQFTPKEAKPLWDVQARSDGWMLACTPISIYLSKDRGVNWDLVYQDKTINLRELLIDTRGNMWAGGTRLLYSTDGTNWQDKTPLLSTDKKISRVSITQDHQNPNRFLAFYGEKYKGIIDQSYDGGKTWNRLYENRLVSRADVHHTEIGIAPDDSNTIFLGTYRAYVSTDGGKHFSVATTPYKYAANFAHDDIRGLHVLAKDDVYLSTDGGVFHSTDSGATWQNLSGKGLTITQAYGMHQLQDGSILMGCQDLGYFLCKDKKWMHLGNYYGDGGDALQTNYGTHILMGGRLKQIDVKTLKSYTNTHPPDRNNPFVAKLVHYPGARDSFYYIGNDVWSAFNGNFTNLTKSIDGKKELVSGFDINASRSTQMFFSYNQPTWNSKKLTGKFFKSEDGGVTWTDITDKLPVLAWWHITGISSNPNKANEIVVSLGKIDDDKLYKAYKSIDGGESWENVSKGLPPYETYGIRHIPNTTGLLITTLAGMYYRNAGMDSWQPLRGKMPPAAIRDFEINVEERRIYTCTYGSGLWYLKIPRKMLLY